DLVLDLSTRRLLLEGARIAPGPERMEEALGDLQRKVRVATVVPFDYTKLPFSAAERAVLQDASEEKRIEQMLERPLARPLLVRAIYAMWVGGILEEVRELARN